MMDNRYDDEENMDDYSTHHSDVLANGAHGNATGLYYDGGRDLQIHGAADGADGG